MNAARSAGSWVLLMPVALLVFLGGSQKLSAAPPTFFNVILADGADPWVIRHSNGYYYLTVSTGVNVTLWRSRSLAGLGGGDRKVAWSPPPAGPASRDLWAPELHFVDGKWYIYVAADDGDWANHRMFVLENENPDPFQGEFVLRGKVFDPQADRWAIDATLLNLKGRLYFVWSGWEGDQNDRQNLYIAPMDNPLRLSGPRVEISRPQFAWEKAGSGGRLPEVNEGPEVIVRHNAVHIVYSAGGSWTDDYCLGVLTARLSSDLLAPTSWKKSQQPVFHRGNGILGPGHCSFVKSPDDKEDWIIYHNARYSNARWNRLVRAQPFTWQKSGVPNFGLPIAPNAPIRLPGGDPPHVRYEAEHARLGGLARIIPRPEASNNAKVGYIDSPDSFVTFVVSAAAAGTHILSVRFGNGMPERQLATHKVEVNQAAAGELSYPYSGWDNWSNAFLAVELQKGKNTIRLSKGISFGEVDCLDIFPITR